MEMANVLAVLAVHPEVLFEPDISNLRELDVAIVFLLCQGGEKQFTRDAKIRN